MKRYAVTNSRLVLSMAIAVLTVCATTGTAQEKTQLTIDRIYVEKEFEEKSYSAEWLPGLNNSNAAFFRLEAPRNGSLGKDIVRHDCDGNSIVMVAASQLIPPGEATPIEVEGVQFSADQNLVLIFTNSKRVWRNNTRGDYWLLDRGSRQLRKLGGEGPSSSMMFAKLSPTGKEVAFVRERNIFVEHLADHSIRQLTYSNSIDIINGTTDWVYEEELSLRDAFVWNSDGTSIAYWQLNTEQVAKFPLLNNTDTLYPTVTWFAYPKVGQRNPSCRVGVVDCNTAQTRWIEIPGDPAEHYLPRMTFLPRSKSSGTQDRLLIQQLNRLQNTNRLYLAVGDRVSQVLAETDEAWVDVHDELFWLADGSQFTVTGRIVVAFLSEL